MRPLEPSELLLVWERGVGAPPALALRPLLAAACPELPPDRLARLTVGERDALLLSQREWMFGPQLDASDACPACGERLEFTLTIDALRAAPAVTDASGLGQGGALSAAVEGYQVAFHAPTLGDVEGVTSVPELLARCVTRATRDGKPQAVAELPAAVIEAIGDAMVTADPQADIQLALNCPACGHDWLAPFDIAVFLWAELQAWAQRTLLEVHGLARAYAWREADILALSPARRAIYLAMIGAAE